MKRFWFAAVMILAAAFSRLIPHPPNVAPIAAMALVGGVYFDRRFAIAVPLFALFLSDLVIGFHNLMVFVYGSFLAMSFIGLWLKSHKNIASVAAASVVSSVMFFIITNFGVWLLDHSVYPRTFAGLAECYTLAIPFFRNTVIGDIAYTGALFGLFELVDRYVPATKQSETSV